MGHGTRLKVAHVFSRGTGPISSNHKSKAQIIAFEAVPCTSILEYYIFSITYDKITSSHQAIDPSNPIQAITPH